MNQRPIVFSSEMIRAILDGRKTQTRRLMRNQPPTEFKFVGKETGVHYRWRGYSDFYESEANFTVKCPYGQPGDELWVRETLWRNGGYVATDKPLIAHNGKISAIFMPRLDSRITLKITEIRAERVQWITEDDAKAEGAILEGWKIDGRMLATRIQYFKELWDSINAKRDYPWDSNPWVWVVAFEVMNQNSEKQQ